MAQSLPKYRYPRLDPSLRTIRLLRLLAASRYDDIRCELTHCYLDHPKQYEAISYCWGIKDGERQRTCPITLDGQKFMVSPVVEDILGRLRRSRDDRLLWLDLVCIDQNSVADRELQVSRMAEIFRCAQQVNVSLGPHEFTVDRGSASETIVRSAGQLAATGVEPSAWFFNQSELEQLFDHPWFERVWVVQEVAFARNIRVVAGSAEVSGVFAAQLLKVLDESRPPQHVPRHLKPLLRLMTPPNKTYAQSDLLTVIQNFRSCKATLPADKVYALMQLCAPAWRLQVDYKIPTEQVFVNAVWSILKKTSSLEVLCSTDPRAHLGGNRLPSWVPDWTRQYQPDQHVPEQPQYLKRIPEPEDPRGARPGGLLDKLKAKLRSPI